MRTITTNDGKVWEVTRCGAADGMLWIELAADAWNDTVTAAATYWGKSKVTKVIRHDWDGNDQVAYNGYTTLRRVGDLGGALEIVLEEA